MAKVMPKYPTRDSSLPSGTREQPGTGLDSGAELTRSKARSKTHDKAAVRAIRERREVKLQKERRKEKEKKEVRKERKDYSRSSCTRESHRRTPEPTNHEGLREKTSPVGGTKEVEDLQTQKQRLIENKGRLWSTERTRADHGLLDERDAAKTMSPGASTGPETTASAAAAAGATKTSVKKGPKSLPADPSIPPPESVSAKGVDEDALNTEFIYFSAALRQLVSELPPSKTRRITIAWLRKLFSPEYHCESLREKRNRYLMMVCGALLVGSPWGLLGRPPPAGPLPEPKSLSVATGPSAAWQRIDPWATPAALEVFMASDATVVGPKQTPLWGVLDDAGAAPGAACSLHGSSGKGCPRVDERATTLLDDEFRLLTWLARPHARALPDARTRATAAAWTRLLAAVGPSACGILKGMRNDYALALLSQLADGQLQGPLATAPSSLAQMLPLAEAARLAAGDAVTDATCDLSAPPVQGFVRAQPRLHSGAFCYVLVNP